MNAKGKRISVNILLLLALCISCLCSFAQDKTSDSLKSVLEQQREDTNKVNTIRQLCIYLADYAHNNNQIRQYAKEALALSKKLYFNEGKRWSFITIINASYRLDDHIATLYYCDSALAFFKQSADKQGLGLVFQARGICHGTLGDTTEAISNFYEALTIQSQLNDLLRVSQTSNSIGEIFCKQGRYAEALDKHTAALKICEVPGFNDDGWGRAFSYQSIGIVYAKMGDEAAAKGNSAIANKYWLKAIEINGKAYQLWDEAGRIDALTEMDYATGNLYFKLGNFSRATENFKKSLDGYAIVDSKEGLNNLYLAMSKLDSAKGNYKEAYKYFKLYMIEEKKITDQDIIRKAEGVKFKSKIEQKEYELKLLATENKLQTEIGKSSRQKKNIAYAGLVFVILGSGYGFYLFRKRKQLQNRQAMIGERLRISQELHDEVGATLSGIAMYSHLAKEQIKNPQTGAIENSLSIIQSNAGEMVNKLNDIVWLINPGQDSLQQLMQRLEDYAIQIAAVKNIRVKSNVNGHHSTNILPAETRRNIYLLFKEAINNAVKYSSATLLELYIKEQDGNIEISLKDDGDGFDMNVVKRGNGINNMEKRAAETGASFSLQSRAGSGTSISLCLKNFSFS